MVEGPCSIPGQETDQPTVLAGGLLTSRPPGTFKSLIFSPRSPMFRPCCLVWYPKDFHTWNQVAHWQFGWGGSVSFFQKMGEGKPSGGPCCRCFQVDQLWGEAAWRLRIWNGKPLPLRFLGLNNPWRVFQTLSLFSSRKKRALWLDYKLYE